MLITSTFWVTGKPSMFPKEKKRGTNLIHRPSNKEKRLSDYALFTGVLLIYRVFH